jgi:hypothetical protein
VKCRTLRCIRWRLSQTRRCDAWERQVQLACLRWEQTWTALCAQWETRWEQLCRQWETTWEQRCTQWETTQTQRCDRWEEERHKQCSDWHWLIAWLCLAWVWITTTVCRLWVWVTTTICKVWAWVSTTICKVWAWVSTTICKLWTLVSTLLCKLWGLVTTWICRLWVLVTTLICTVFAFFVDLACLIFCRIRRLFAPNEFSEARSECIYGWTAAFRITEDRECVLTITLRIRLNPDAGVTQQQLQAAQTTWEQAIEQAWSGRFRIRRRNGNCACEEYRVVVDVQFVTTNEHHVVRVRAGSGRADMTNWFITSTGGTAAHEAGHMFGNADEYADPACPARTVTSDNSIMQTTSGTVRPRHYERFAAWVSNRTCCDYTVVEGD